MDQAMVGQVTRQTALCGSVPQQTFFNVNSLISFLASYSVTYYINLHINYFHV